MSGDLSPIAQAPVERAHQAPVALARQAAPAGARKKPDIAQAAREFEGMLLSQLMQSMRSTVQPSGLFGNEGGARSTYEYLMDQAVIEKAAKAGRGFGLAAQLERLWNQRQAEADGQKHPEGLGKRGAMPIGLMSR